MTERSKPESAARTPGPWSVSNGGVKNARHIFVDGDGGRSVCSCHGRNSEAEANAAFIVEACNAYSSHAQRSQQAPVTEAESDHSATVAANALAGARGEKPAVNLYVPLREALEWYADGVNCRRGMFGSPMRNGNRNAWIPDNGDRARAALAAVAPHDRSDLNETEPR